MYGTAVRTGLHLDPAEGSAFLSPSHRFSFSPHFPNSRSRASVVGVVARVLWLSPAGAMNRGTVRVYMMLWSRGTDNGGAVKVFLQRYLEVQ